ncbi:MAG: hypothetical protein SOY06_06775 [Prevotella sp.]|nr:hypothetical protein [Bacteroidales bacterium]MDY4229533.1 hypothetical protein [Prevotella sp.]
MIHYGEDLKDKLRLGLVKDLEAATHHIAEARSEWLLRIAPVYNVAALWLNDAVDYAKKAGIYRFGIKHSMKFADRYIENGIKEVVRYAMDSEGQKFLLDFFDNSEDILRGNTQGLYYPIYNYISKLGFHHLDVCAALGVSLAVAELAIKAESQLQDKWREAWGYTVPLIVDMRKFPDLLRNVIGVVEPNAAPVGLADDKACLIAMNTFIAKAFSVKTSEIVAGEALAKNPAIRRELDREALREAKRNAD